MEETASQKTFKDYISLYSGQLFSLLGSSITQFILIWWITIKTASPAMLSIASFL
jgi:DHA3 family macrolide efflux protein-like MFS transporter